MKQQGNTKNEVTAQPPIFDPFPEPRTLPEGWDLSAFVVRQDVHFMVIRTSFECIQTTEKV